MVYVHSNTYKINKDQQKRSTGHREAHRPPLLSSWLHFEMDVAHSILALPIFSTESRKAPSPATGASGNFKRGIHSPFHHLRTLESGPS